MADVIQKIFDIKLNYGSVVEQLVKLTKQSNEFAEAEKKLNEDLKAGNITSQQYNKNMAALAQAKKANSAEQKKYTTALQNEIKSQAKEIAAVDQMISRFERLKSVYDRMTDSQKQRTTGQNIANEMLSLSQQINQATQQIANQSNTLQRSASSINGLKTRLAELKNEYSALSEADRNSSYGKNLSKEITKLNTQIKEEASLLQQTTKGFDKNSTSINALRERLKSLTAQFDNLSRVEREGFKGNVLTTHIKKVRKEIFEAEQATGRFQRNVGNYASALKSFGLRFANIALGFTTVAQGFVLAGNKIKESISDVIQFNREISRLSAITMDSKENINMLVAEAKRLGAETRYTAIEVAQLQVELAKLGYTKSEIMAMSESVLNLAQATGSGLAEAAQLAGAALRVFGDDATQLTKYVDQMAVATAKSALDFEFIKTALPIVGGAADMFGFDLQDTLTLLAQLANSGMEASMAATATRNIFLKLADSSGVLNQQLGKPVKNLDDLLNGLSELRARGANLNDALEMTNVRAAVAFTRFMNTAEAAKKFAKELDWVSASEEDIRNAANEAGVSIEEMRKQMEGCKGTAKEMAEIFEDNLGGDITRLGSAWDDLMISFQKGQGPLRWVVDKVRELVKYLGDVARSVDESKNQLVSQKTQEYASSTEFSTTVDNDIKKYEEERDRLVAGGMELSKAMAEAQVKILGEIDKETNDILSKNAKDSEDALNQFIATHKKFSNLNYQEIIRERDRIEKNIYGSDWKKRMEKLSEVNLAIKLWEDYAQANAAKETQENRKNAFSTRANKNDNTSGIGAEDSSKANRRASREKSAAKALLDAQIAYENSLLKIRKESRKKQMEVLDNQYKHEIEKLQYKITEELKMRGDESNKEREDKLAAINYYNMTIADKQIEWEQERYRLTYEWTQKEYKYTKEMYDLQMEAFENHKESEEKVIKKKYEMQLDLLDKEMQSEIAALYELASKDERIEQEKQERLLAIDKKYANKVAKIKQSQREDLADVEIRKNQTYQNIFYNDSLKVLESQADEAMKEYQKLQGETTKATMSASELALKESQAWNKVLASLDAVAQKKVELATQQLELDAMVRNSDVKNEFGNNQRVTSEIERAQTEVDIAKMKYEQIEARGKLNAQTMADFELEKAQAYSDYVQKKQSLVEKEADLQRSLTSAYVGGWAKIADAIASASDENKEAAAIAKMIGLAEIYINQGISIAEAIKTATPGDPYTVAGRVASAVASVIAGTISAFASINKAKFAKGAVNIQGAGTNTSDSINARISQGESIMTAKATKMFGNLLTIMNQVAAQPNVTLPTQYSSYNPVQTNASNEAMTESMRDAVAEINPVVSVVDIEDATERVNKIKVLDTF